MTSRAVLMGIGLFLTLLAGCGAAGGVYHQVADGQTLYRISRVYGIDENYLARINGITDPTRLRTGDRIFIPGATKVQKITPPAVKPPAVSSVPPAAGITAKTTSSVSSPAVVAVPPLQPASKSAKSGKTPPAAVSVPTKKPTAPPPPRQPSTVTSAPPAATSPPPAVAGRFLWPVRGTLLRRFGSGGGTSGKGLEIGVPANTPVVAAAAGRVIYSGDGISSYGNLIIVKHDDTFFTVYGYNARNLVPSGTFVSKGEKIALVGMPPGGGKARLYFEIRYGKEAVDPTIYLP